MGKAAQKVKPFANQRLQVALEKTVTLHLTSVIEVEVRQIVGASTIDETARNQRAINNAVNERLSIERCNEIERQWLTEKINENPQISIQWASIVEMEPYIKEDETVEAL